MRVLDELATDFVIETCHKANQVANLSGRQKVKVDDFKFAIRGNEAMLGKVQELFSSERKIKVGAFLLPPGCVAWRGVFCAAIYLGQGGFRLMGFDCV